MATVIATLATLATLALAASPGHATTRTESLTFYARDGLSRNWIAPEKTLIVRVVVVGASAGSGGVDCGNGCRRIPGSRVGLVTAEFVPVAGQVFTIYPGSAGANGGNDASCWNVGGVGGTSAYGLNGGHGGDAGCVGRSGGGGGGGAGSAFVGEGVEIIAGGAGGGAGNRNSGDEWWQRGYDEGSLLTGRPGGNGVNPWNDGGGGGGGGGGFAGGAGGDVAIGCCEFAGNGGVRGSSHWTGADGQGSLIEGTGDGYVTVTWTVNVESPASAPRDLSITSATVTGASISWRAPSDIGEPALSSYELDVRAVDSAAWTTVATFPAEATSAELRDLPCGQQLQIRLRAMNTVGSSEPSEEIPWESTSSKFQMCPTSPVSAAIGQPVTLSVVGARIPAGYLGTGNVVFTVKGQSLVGEVNANGNASVTFVPSNRGKAAITASLAQLSPRGQLAKIIKVSGYAWTASFSAPKTALVGQSLQLTGTYVAPGQTVIVSWADGTASVTADASGTIKVPMKMVTRGTQQVEVSQGTRTLFSSFIKVGGKQSTW